MANKKLHRRYELLAEIRKDERASIRELADRMQIKSPSQVYGLLRELEDEGLIRREERLARSIQLGGQPRAKSKMKARHTSPAKTSAKKRRAPRRQSPTQLEKAIDKVVRDAQSKAMTVRDGQTWHLRKEYK